MEAEADSDTRQLFQHIGNKGIQAGAILGTFASVPFMAWRHTRQGGYIDADFTPRAMKAVTRTTLLLTSFSLLSGLGLIGFKEGFNKEKISDRVYRLQHNKQQNRCDHFAYGGAVAGSALSCLRGFPSFNSFAGLALFGTAAGVLTHVITSQEEEGKKVEALQQSVGNMAKELS